MKACVLTTSFPRWPGDHAGRFVHELMRHLVREGVQPTVVAPRGVLPDGSPTPLAEVREGVEIVRFPYFLRRHERLAYGSGIPANVRSRPLTCLAQAPFLALAFVRAVRRVAKGCDVVQANWALTGLLAERAAPSVPRVVSVRGSDVNRLPEKGLLAGVIRGVLRRADAVVALSSQLAESVVARGVSRERVWVVPNGVDLPPTPAPHPGGSWTLIWVGRMTVEKDVRTLIEAFRRVRQAQPGARLVLVGDGPEGPGVRRQVSALGLDGSVVFAGTQPFERVADFYARADVLLLSSTSEGGGNVVLEGMAHGLPVVATAVGFAREFVRDGENGRLVPPGDAAAMADAILSVVASAEVCERMGGAARRTVEPLTWQRAAQEYQRIFAHVVAARRGTAGRIAAGERP